MQRIIKYKLDDDGTYSAVITGISLGNDETQLLDEGYSIAVDVQVYDPYKITDKQRRKIFALVNDIEAHTGQPSEYMRGMFIHYLQALHGTEKRISMASCSKREASDLIDVIITWIFQNHIPLNYKTSDLMRNDNYFIYLSTINRQCIICGAPNSDIAHLEAVGSGRDRRTHDHTNHHVLALCRLHHGEQHDIGIKSFNDKYVLTNSWVKVTPEINKKLQGR